MLVGWEKYSQIGTNDKCLKKQLLHVDSDDCHKHMGFGKLQTNLDKEKAKYVDRKQHRTHSRLHKKRCDHVVCSLAKNFSCRRSNVTKKLNLRDGEFANFHLRKIVLIEG